MSIDIVLQCIRSHHVSRRTLKWSRLRHEDWGKSAVSRTRAGTPSSIWLARTCSFPVAYFRRQQNLGAALRNFWMVASTRRDGNLKLPKASRGVSRHPPVLRADLHVPPVVPVGRKFQFRMEEDGCQGMARAVVRGSVSVMELRKPRCW